MLLSVFTVVTIISLSVHEVGAKTKTATVSSSSGLAVYTGADKSCAKSTKCKYKKVGTLKNQTKVTVYKENVNGWAQIKYKNEKRYINNAFLRYYSPYSEKKVTTIFKQIEEAQSIFVELGYVPKKYVVKRLDKTHTSAYIEKFLAFDMVKSIDGKSYDKRGNYQEDSITYEVYAFDLPSAKAKLSHYKQGTTEYLTVSYKFEADDIGWKIIPSGTLAYKLVKANNSGWKISDKTVKYDWKNKGLYEF